MLVFFYDKTFEGLLTAVFDAYSRKTFPDRILGEGEIAPMFMEESYTVITQEDRAARVWTALEKKMTKQACNMLTHTWLSEEEGSDELLFRYIRKTIDSPRSIETNFGDEDVLTVHQIARKVAHEGHYLRMFIRFQKAADDIFFAPISPIFNALPLAIDHFADRFSDQKWVIYDLKRKYGYYYDLHSVQEITLENDEHLLSGKLDENLMAEDEKLFQELWKGYFNSMTIKERINPRLQRQHMPKRFWKYLTEKQ
ncbi:TIGR03915 family putative DNA repair protein [Dysgonomonas sp. 520]|uniref:TIGR03915 family putative DNA repair protein n=1 Tax=Dysgonomonas sp. 520 TaxID=2302931 RepID=UPI0013D7C320|nr:TIGR03915 family putative DNA repair protein [Dysgonomonas sp. 520]NDW10795.1 DNA metabolism protein [Dysgonomonas sp. 520]